MQLLPTFGCFMPHKKDCVISFDGEYPSALENVYRVSLIVNINKDKLMDEKAVTWIKIENNPIGNNEELVKELIENMIQEYNIILHTDNSAILEKLILSNLYGFGDTSVGLSSHDKTKNTRDWYEYIQSVNHPAMNGEGLRNEC